MNSLQTCTAEDQVHTHNANVDYRGHHHSLPFTSCQADTNTDKQTRAQRKTRTLIPYLSRSQTARERQAECQRAAMLALNTNQVLIQTRKYAALHRRHTGI